MGNTEEQPQDLQAFPKNDIFPIKKGQKESLDQTVAFLSMK